MGLSSRSVAVCSGLLALLCLASVALAQPRGPVAMPGSGSGGPGMGSGGPGMGGGGETLEEPKNPQSEVEVLQFALLCAKTAIETYNEGSTDEQGAPPGSGRYATIKGDVDKTTNESGALKKELYRWLWSLYDQIGQYYRQRDQLADAAAIYEECIGYMPKDPNWPTYGSGGGGSGGAPMGGAPGSSGGPAGPSGPSGPGGPSSSGGAAPAAGPGGGMGGQGGGGAADVWEELPGPMHELIRSEIMIPAYFRLGQVYYESHRLEEANEVLDANVHRVGAQGDSAALLGQIDLLLGRDESSAANTIRGAAFGPNAAAVTNVGIAEYRIGHILEALDSFRTAAAQPVAADGSNVEGIIVALNYIGAIDMSRGDLRAADRSFRRMVELIPKWDARLQGEKRYSTYRDGQRRMLSATVAAYSNLGSIAERDGRHDDAVALNMGAVQAADLLARLEQSDTGASIGDMDRALEVVAAAYQNAAVSYMSRGAANQGKTHGGRDLGGAMADYEAAIDLLEKAVASSPQDDGAWNCLGKAYYAARKFYDAEMCFEHAVQINGEKTEYRVNLQAASERLGSAPRDPR